MCNCECPCSCAVIDTSKPEDYEIKEGGQWKSICAIFNGHGRLGPLYHVVFKYDYMVTRCCTVPIHDAVIRIRKKQEWQPTPGKLYMYSDNEKLVGTYQGNIRRACKVVGYKGCWRAVSLTHHDARVQWKYCWPIPLDKLQEEAGE